VRLGNRYGVSWAAEEAAKRILSGLTEQRWSYYVNECLPGDEIILGKLTDETIAARWIQIVAEENLAEIEVKDRVVKELITKLNKLNQRQVVVIAAKKIHGRLTSRARSTS